MSEPAPQIDAEDAVRGHVNQLEINGQLMPVIIPGSVLEALRDLGALFAAARNLEPLIPIAMPWAQVLPETDLPAFADQLREAASSGPYAPEKLAATLRDWRATAELYVDPAEAERLSQARQRADEAARKWRRGE
jgi:hypothetical protein